MAKVEDLIKNIPDAKLRDEIAREVSKLKSTKKFGLVFEEHLPELAQLPGLAVKAGVRVVKRGDKASEIYNVLVVDGGSANVSRERDGQQELVSLRELVVIKKFGEPIYPALVPVDRVTRAPDKPYHTIINAENFHALQLLLYCYEGQVDVIYIDPPYNTGARDWKYNNNYVDKTDAFGHSKWLSMVKKRLVLAKRLLKPDGIVIVTIDENEVHHLGMLLESLFADAERQMITICVNPSGVSGRGLSRVDEYAFLCFLGNAKPAKTADDMLTGNTEKVVRWESLLRGGNAWYRKSRPNLCYPILLDVTAKKIIGTGPPFDGDDELKRPRSVNGCPVAWPVRLDGKLGIWRVESERLMGLVAKGYAYLSSRNEDRDAWTIRYLMSGTIKSIEADLIKVTGYGGRGQVKLETSLTKSTLAKTMWYRGRHTAGGAGGTHILVDFLGERNLFPFPKSLYAVHDCLSIAALNLPEAIILDFFAGSGTTLHATALMNWRDGGRRQCISVTNNEVSDERHRDLTKCGVFAGDETYEAQGIANAVTWPRCKAAIEGRRPDGTAPEGTYLETNNEGVALEMSEGFDENIEYFKLDFLDPNEVAYGDKFEAILPILWLMAGGKGEMETARGYGKWFIPKHSPYAVLLKEDYFSDFQRALESRPDIAHLFLVTDSEEAYHEMVAELPRKTETRMLYKSYLDNFRINTEQNL